jgi:hypothetical protein
MPAAITSQSQPPESSSKSSMKVWGWISASRSIRKFIHVFNESMGMDLQKVFDEDSKRT